jgi:hypothetical protein
MRSGAEFDAWKFTWRVGGEVKQDACSPQLSLSAAHC